MTKPTSRVWKEKEGQQKDQEGWDQPGASVCQDPGRGLLEGEQTEPIIPDEECPTELTRPEEEQSPQSEQQGGLTQHFLWRDGSQ